MSNKYLRRTGRKTTAYKEDVRLRGRLRGQGGERFCSVQATKMSTHADEMGEPLRITYEGVTVSDRDDFPDGRYELTFGFDGIKLPLTRKDGCYHAGRNLAKK